MSELEAADMLHFEEVRADHELLGCRLDKALVVSKARSIRQCGIGVHHPAFLAFHIRNVHYFGLYLFQFLLRIYFWLNFYFHFSYSSVGRGSRLDVLVSLAHWVLDLMHVLPLLRNDQLFIHFLLFSLKSGCDGFFWGLVGRQIQTRYFFLLSLLSINLRILSSFWRYLDYGLFLFSWKSSFKSNFPRLFVFPHF